MALVIDIADAVVAELNAAPAGTFDPVFTAVRRVLPEFDLAELAELKVTVVPKAVEITGATRSVGQFDFQVDIGVQKKLGKDLDTETAALCRRCKCASVCTVLPSPMSSASTPPMPSSCRCESHARP